MNDMPWDQSPVLLMLDYDGTLTPIVPNYETAQITPEQLAFLRDLAHQPQVQLGIVSGRSVDSLLAFLGTLKGEPLYLVGLHGGEVYDLEQQRYLLEPETGYQSAITAFKTMLHDMGVDRIPGVQLEDKRFSLGLHYRQATPEDSEKALALFEEAVQRQGLLADFILRPGKKLLEVVPKGFNKGKGVEELIPLAQKRFSEPPYLVYIGDDITDFDAFRAVNAHDGMSVYVGDKPPTECPLVTKVLPNVDAVYEFLNQHFIRTAKV